MAKNPKEQPAQENSENGNPDWERFTELVRTVVNTPPEEAKRIREEHPPNPEESESEKNS